jgi:hypothetical protein
MPEDVIFFVPVKVTSEANASFSRNWWEKTKRKNGLNQALDLYLRNYSEFPCPCDVKLTRSGKRALDDDNLAYAFKSIRDHLAYRIVSKFDNLAPNLALVDSKVNKGWYDSDPRVFWLYGQEKGPVGFWVSISGRKP